MISFRYRTIIARKEKIFRKPDENLFLMVLYTHGDDKMNQIEQARLEIDSVDKEIARLYEKRLDAVKEVLEYKKANALPILDAGREDAIIEKNQKYIQNKEYVDSYIDFMKKVMSNSRDFQQTLLSSDVVAYAGVKGAFSQIVASRMFPAEKKLNYTNFEDVFKAVVNKDAQYGIIPFENTNSGLVGEVLDALLEYPVYIQQVVDQRVEQCLLGVENATLKDVEWVYSKDQALAQSKVFLKGLNVQTVAYPNTAMAAQYVASQNDVRKAAIGAKENADLYGLKILAENIEENVSNTTRFIVIGLEPQTQGNRFSVCLIVKHQSGALARIIETIAQHGLNMQSIQSRPIKNRPFEYFFFIEMDGNLEMKNTRECLKDIKKVTQSVKYLGTYSLKGKDD